MNATRPIVFPQFLAALSEWASESELRQHRALIRRLYVEFEHVADAGDFLACYLKQKGGK